MRRWLPWLLGGATVCLILIALFSDTPEKAMIAVAALVTAVSGLISVLVEIRKNGQ
jgi:hypothetical protein